MGEPIQHPAANRWFRLDRSYRVVAVGSHVDGQLAQAVGHNLWRFFPGAQEAFEPAYERAWENGIASETVSFAGNLVLVHARCNEDDTLCVAYESVTLQGLRTALDRLEHHHDRSAGQRDDGAPEALATPLRSVV